MKLLSITKRVGAGAAAALLLAGCSGQADKVASTTFDMNGPAIEYVDCWMNHAESNGSCGLLRVPVSYDDPQGAARKVSFVVLPALNPPAGPEKDPVVFFIGGPGPAGSFTPEFDDGAPGAYLREDRKLIMVDYRGVGMSDPFLPCGGPEDLPNCKRVLDQSGMSDELRTATFVKDADRLLEQLGYDSVVLYGGSYGTRVALTMMRDKPERISHVIIDGVFPVEVNGFAQGPRSLLAGLNHIAQVCEEDAACTTQLGDIRAKVEKLASGWQGREGAADLLGTLATLSHYQAAPLLIDHLSSLSPDDAASVTMQFMEGEAFGEGEPPEGEGEGAEREMPPGFERSQSMVMSLGIICSEEAAFIDQQPLNEVRHGFSKTVVDMVRDSSSGAPLPPPVAKQVCKKMGFAAAPDVEMEPVRSAIPTLVLSGGMDLQTSFEWGDLAANSLENSQHFILPFAGHVVAMSDPCAKDIASQFTKNPEADIDDSCLTALQQRSQDLILSSPDVVADIKKEFPEEL